LLQEEEDRMDTRTGNREYFKREHPEAWAAYEAFGKALHEAGPLSPRDAALVKVAVAAASQYDYALRSHIERAVEAGCTRAELEHAVMLVATTAGFPRMMSALMILRDELP